MHNYTDGTWEDLNGKCWYSNRSKCWSSNSYRKVFLPCVGISDLKRTLKKNWFEITLYIIILPILNSIYEIRDSSFHE